MALATVVPAASGSDDTVSPVTARMPTYRSPAARAASPTSTAPATIGVGRPGPASRSPTAATGGSEASANAPSGPPEMRSETIPPRNAHHTPSRAPAATDQEAATNI